MSLKTFPDAPTLAIDTLYRSHAGFLKKIATCRFGLPAEAADDVVQEVFLSYLRTAEHVYDPHKWLLGAVCNASRYYWRRHGSTDPLPELASDLEDSLHCALSVRAILNRLTPRCREVLRRQYFEGYETKEIARQLDTSHGYARQLLHRCMKTARRLYRHEQ